MSSSSYVSNLLAVLSSPWDYISKGLYIPATLGGAALGYFFWVPLIGASETISVVLATVAFARSFAKTAVIEAGTYNQGGDQMMSTMGKILAYGVLPLGAMYLSAQVMPLVDISGGLAAYAAYVAVAAATMSYSQTGWTSGTY